jgi:hypothetical protein
MEKKMKLAQGYQQDLFQGDETAQGVLNREGQGQVKELLEELLTAVLKGEEVEREKAHE